MSRPTPVPSEWAGLRIWTCNVCGRSEPWGSGWEWYGSLKIEEDCGHLVATCSPACRAKPKAARLIADFEAKHPAWGSGLKRGCRS